MAFGFWEAVLSFLTRQIGLRTDAADPAGSLHAKLSNTISYGTLQRETIASNTLRFSADAERLTSGGGVSGNATYQCLKQISVAFPGKYRISFDLCGAYSGGSYHYGYGRIYVDGAARGTERSTNSTSYVTFTEDLYLPKGGTIQLYAKSDHDTVSIKVRNFRVYFDYATSPPLNGYVVQD